MPQWEVLRDYFRNRGTSESDIHKVRDQYLNEFRQSLEYQNLPEDQRTAAEYYELGDEEWTLHQLMSTVGNDEWRYTPVNDRTAFFDSISNISESIKGLTPEQRMQLRQKYVHPIGATTIESWEAAPDDLPGIINNAVLRGVEQSRLAWQAFDYSTGAGIGGTTVEDISDTLRTIQRIPVPEGVIEANEAQSVGQWFKAVMRNPSHQVDTMLSSAIASFGTVGAPSLAGILGGAALGGPKGALVGGAAGAFAGSILLEGAGEYFDYLESIGVDVENADEIKAAFLSPEIKAQATEYAAKKAIPVALMDAITMGLAGIATPAAAPVKSGVMRWIAGIVADEMIQASGEMAGEALGQLIQKGKIQIGSVLAEGLAGAASGPAQTAIGVGIRRAAARAASEVESLIFKPDVPAVETTQRTAEKVAFPDVERDILTPVEAPVYEGVEIEGLPASWEMASEEQQDLAAARYEELPIADPEVRRAYAIGQISESRAIDVVAEERGISKDAAADQVAEAEIAAEEKLGVRVLRDPKSRVEQMRRSLDSYRNILAEKMSRVKGVEITPNDILISHAITEEQRQVESVAKNRGKKVVWFQSNAPVEGIRVEPGVIALQSNATPGSNLRSVMVHELAHDIKNDNPDAYNVLVRQLKKTPEWQPAEAQARAQLKEADMPTTSDVVNDEVVSYIATNNADVIWDVLTGEPEESGLFDRVKSVVGSIKNVIPGLKNQDIGALFAPVMRPGVEPAGAAPAAVGAAVPGVAQVPAGAMPSAAPIGAPITEELAPTYQAAEPFAIPTGEVVPFPGTGPLSVPVGAPSEPAVAALPMAVGAPPGVAPPGVAPAPGPAPGVAPPGARQLRAVPQPEPKDKAARQERFKLTNKRAVRPKADTAPAAVLKDATKRESYARYWQNKFEPLRRLMRDIAQGQGEYYSGGVDETIDVFLHAEGYSAKVASALRRSQELIDKLTDIIKGERPQNISTEEWIYEDLDLFFQARHAHERNMGIYENRYLKPKRRIGSQLAKIEEARQQNRSKIQSLRDQIAEIPKALGEVLRKIDDAGLSESVRSSRIEKAVESFQGKNEKLKSQIANLEEAIKRETKQEQELKAKLQELESIKEKAAKGSGMSSGITSDEDNVASEVLSSFRDRGLLDWTTNAQGDRVYSGSMARVAERFDQITEHKIKILKDAGIINEQQYTSLKKYKYYAPLKGVRDSETPIMQFLDDYLSGERESFGVGKGFAVTTERRALGRETERPSPIIPNMVADYQAAIVRSEKNDVGKALLNFAREYPDATNQREQKLFEINKIQEKKYFDKKSGEIRDRSFLVKDGALSVVENGDQYYITINDSGIQSAMLNLGPEHAGQVLKTMGNILRFIGRMHTQYNPAFMIPNWFRDLGTAIFTLQRPELKGIALRAIAKTPSRNLEIIKILYGKNSPLKELWDRHIKAGGKIEFWTMMQPEIAMQQLTNAIKDLPAATPHSVEKLISKAPWALKKSAKAIAKIGDHLDNINTAIENGIRFSVFVELVESGMSDAKAARAARNVTLDFTRHGTGNAFWGNLYLFMNANIQGLQQILSTAKYAPRAQAMMAGLMVTGFAMSFMMRLWAGKDPEDGEDYWDKIPDYVKQHNIVIPMPGSANHVKIPLPYGFHLPYVAGGRLMDAMMSDRVTPLNATLDVANATFESFNPLGTSDMSQPLTGLFQMAMPSLADPLTDVVLNRNFWGGPIKPQPSPFLKTKPVQSELYFNSVSEPSKEFAKRMNELFGGSPVESSGPLTDISPEVWDYLIRGYSGGAMATLVQGLSQVAKLIKGEEVDTAYSPVISRFWGEETKWYIPQQYYQNLEMVEQKNTTFKYLQENHPDNADEYYQRNKEFIDIIDDVRRIRKEIAELDKDKREVRMKSFNREMRRIQFED